MNPLESVLGLPEPALFRQQGCQADGWFDHYGALHAAADYAGFTLPERYAVQAIWMHGAFGPWEMITPGTLVMNSPQAANWPVLVARADEADYLRGHGLPRVRAIGLPIAYVPPVETARRPRSLLVMPTHTLNGARFPERGLFERYADEIKSIAGKFERVVVCVHPNCLRNGLWLQEFRSRGFNLVVGAQTGDRHALRRMRTLFAQFETVTTNGWGSHVPYALAGGAKLSIWGTRPVVDAATVLRLDSAWRADPASLAVARSEAVERQRREFLHAFHLPPAAAVADQALGDWFLGTEHRITPADMRDLLRDVVRTVEAPVAVVRPVVNAIAAPLPEAGAPFGELPVVLVRSHEFNYSETFVEDHVNHLTRNLTLLYGYPFPRFVKGGRSVLPAETERKLQTLTATPGAAVPADVWRDYTAGLAAFLRGCGAKAALLESGVMGAFAHEACEQAGLPYVVHFHGVDAFGRELLARWQTGYRKFFARAASVVVVSKAMRTQLVALGAPAEKVVLGPYGVAVDLAQRAEPAQAGPRFVAVGRFVEKKAPHLTLQAFALVQRRVPDARLTMIGDGPLLAPCQQWAAANGLGTAVTFAGVQSRAEVSRHLAASRVFVQHSVTAANGDSEGLPLAVLEAGAHGLPVVSTRHAGIPDAVREGEDGFLGAEKDVKAMAAAMLRLAEDATLAARLGASFRARVESRFSRQRSLERLHAVLTAAAEGRSPQGLGEADEPAAVVPAVNAPSVEAPVATGPRGEIEEDRNALLAYLELGRSLAREGDPSLAYQAIGEAHRLSGGTEETRALLQQLEESGALGEPAVETYRRRAGWLPRRKAAQPRRILVVTNLLPPQEMGGYGRTMWEFSRELLARGHAVRVLTADLPHLLRKPTAEHAAFEPHVRRVLRLCGDWKDGAAVVESDPQRLRELVRGNHQAVLAAAREFRPDAVMVGNLDFVGHQFVQEFLKSGVPVLHRLGNANPGYDPAGAPQSPLFCLAGCSEWVNAGLRAKGYPIKNYAVVPPGSPLTEYFRAFPPQRRRLRVAFASLLMPYKGAHVLVEALAHLRQAGVDFECTLAGDSTSPEYVAALRATAERHGFLERLQFPGFLDKAGLAALYARSNVLVFPSVFAEPFGKTQIEAMAAGLAVVSSGSGGASEVIRDGATGLLFKAGDARDLAGKLVRLHRHPEAAARIAAAGQADAFRFTTAASVDRIDAILQNLIATARRRQPQAAASAA